MSDREIIIQLLRTAEWRIRTNRLLHELTAGLSIVLTLLLALKVWDLFSPFQAVTIGSVVVATVLLFTVFAAWRIRQKGTLDQVAFSIDQKAGLHDEIKTAFWFINNPRSSEWVEKQIQRAAKNARTIDVARTYPNMIPRASYIVAATVLLFIGLNLIPLPFNHNWLMLQAAPPDRASEKGLAPETAIDRKEILKGLQELAELLREAPLLEDTADALSIGDLQGAADDLRNAAQQLGTATQDEIAEVKDALRAAAGADSKAGLEDVLQEMAETGDVVDEEALYDTLMETAEQLEQLGRKIDTPPPEGTNFKSDNPATQNDGEPGAQVPNTGQQSTMKRSNTNGPGTSKAPLGGLAQLPVTSLETQLELGVKLQVEALKGVAGDKNRPRAKDEEEIAEASKREGSKLDYRNVKSELSPAQKDLLNQDHVPWEYRALIKSYFRAIRPPIKK